MKPEKQPVREIKVATNSSRVVPEHEQQMIKDSRRNYSGPRIIDSGEWLPHPPKKP